MTRLLIVNADDYGLTPGVCEAVLRAGDGGIVTSTSALVVAPAWGRHASALASSGLGVGAHLCVVGEDPPLLAASEIPSLVDARGRFPLTWRSFVARAATGRVDADDLRRELGAQVEAVVSSGVRLTHLDSHQHLHLVPAVADVLFELAGERGLTAARLTASRAWTPGALGLRVLGRHFARSCDRRGLATPAGNEGLDDAGRMTLPRLVAAIERLGASGAPHAEIVTHPGAAVDPDRTRYAWGYHWPDELAALTDPRARAAVDAAGFTLGDFGDLAAGGARAAA